MATLIDGPYFEDFSIGDLFSAPSVTLTDGIAAMYQSITADRLRLALDYELSKRVTGNPAPLVHPNLLINVVNGQTTYASQHVKGNLFYRGLIHRQPVFLGDTVTTTTKVVGLRQNRPKPGRPATGMVALEMETTNQNGDVVLHYWRCPMIPCRDPEADTGRADDFDWMPSEFAPEQLRAALPNWDLAPMASDVTGLRPPDLNVGEEYEVAGKDTITCAPELVRLTLNIAYAHSDATRSYLGKRLVYGGHTIALAHQHLTRAIPSLLGVIAWQSCDHLGPVLEDDIIGTRFTVHGIDQLDDGSRLLDIELTCIATRLGADEPQVSDVLAWRLYAWCV